MMPTLHRWQLVTNGRAKFAIGYLYGDPSIRDGSWIRTARIIEQSTDDAIIRTRARTYRLGKPA